MHQQKNTQAVESQVANGAPAEIPFKVIEDLDALLPELAEESIISRTVWKSSAMKATLFGFDAGQALSDHSAGQDAIAHVLSGAARITLGPPRDQPDAEPTVVEGKPGTWIYMPAHLPHSVQAETPTKMLLLLLKG